MFKLSKKLLGLSFTFGAGIAITLPPFEIIFLNASNDTSSSKNSFVKSDKIIGFLKSGLSVPYLVIASLKVSLGKGNSVTSKFENFLKTSYMTGSIAENISSCSTKDISMSN